MRWINTSMQYRLLGVLRWVVSIVFFFLGMTKASLLIQYGLEPYRLIVDAAGLPEIIKYYGPVAVAVELLLAVGLWVEGLFDYTVILAAGLTVFGVGLSIFFLVFKLNSDCGCGLLGDSESGLLVQKIIILIVLGVLYKYRSNLFTRELQT